MNTDKFDKEKYEKVKKRVQELKGFYSHLISFLFINAVLLAINLVTDPGDLWFRWVTIFWGIGLLIHAINIFVMKGQFLGPDWEEKKIKELMEKDDKK